MDSGTKPAKASGTPAASSSHTGSHDKRGPERQGFTSVLARAVQEASLAEQSARLLRAANADGIAIAMSDGTNIVCRASQGCAPEVGVVLEPGVGLCGKCIEEGQIVVEQQINGDIRSLVAVPIMAGEAIHGCVAAFCTRANGFDNSHIAELIATASRLGRYEAPVSAAERGPDYVPEVPILPDGFASGIEGLADDEIEKLLASFNEVPPGVKLPTASEPVEVAAVVSGEELVPAEPLSVVPQQNEVLAKLEQSGDGSVALPAEPVLTTETKRPIPVTPPARNVPLHPNADVILQVMGTHAEPPRKRPTIQTKPPVQEAKPLVVEEKIDPAVPAIVDSADYPQPESTGIPNLFEGKKAWILWSAIATAVLVVVLAGIFGSRYYMARIPPTPIASPAAPVIQPPKDAFPSVTPMTNAAGSATTPKKAVVAPPVEQASAPLVVEPGRVERRQQTPEVEPPSVPLGNTSMMNTAVPLVGSTVVPTLTPPAKSTFQQAKLIQRVNPRYPEFARRMRMTGAVEMELTISQTGSVSAVRVLSGEPVLAQSATAAVRQWKYEPAQSNGTSVESKVRLTIRFTGQ